MPDTIISGWCNANKIFIRPKADTPNRVKKAQRLVYTWRDCFAKSVKDIQVTDLLEHSIDLMKDAKPIKKKTSKYTAKERDFANKIFSAIENAGIIT